MSGTSSNGSSSPGTKPRLARLDLRLRADFQRRAVREKLNGGAVVADVEDDQLARIFALDLDAKRLAVAQVLAAGERNLHAARRRIAVFRQRIARGDRRAVVLRRRSCGGRRVVADRRVVIAAPRFERRAQTAGAALVLGAIAVRLAPEEREKLRRGDVAVLVQVGGALGDAL